MTFQLVAYGKLKESIKESVDTLLIEHKLKTKEEDKLTDDARSKRVQGLKDKHPERHVQSQYLLKVIELLETSEDNEKNKAMVLNAAAFYIHGQIKDSYENSKLTYLPKVGAYIQNPKNSSFYSSLGVSLNLREGNHPNEKDTFSLYQSLLEFMKAQVYHPEGLTKGFKSDHCFSEEKISGYQVDKDIKKLSQKVLELEFVLIDSAEKLYKSQKNTGESYAGKGYTLFREKEITLTILADYNKTSPKESKSEDFLGFCEEGSFDTSEEQVEQSVLECIDEKGNTALSIGF